PYLHSSLHDALPISLAAPTQRWCCAATKTDRRLAVAASARPQPKGCGLLVSAPQHAHTIEQHQNDQHRRDKAQHEVPEPEVAAEDRKSTRLNSSHVK